MKKTIVPKVSSFQLGYERVLRIAMVILALGHMMLSVFRYAFDYYTLARPIECWYAVGLIVMAMFYVLINWVSSPETFYRIRDFLKRVKSAELLLLVGLGVWYVLSCTVNQIATGNSYLRASDWWILDAFISALILFPMCRIFSLDKFRKVVEWMLHVLMLCATVFFGWALYNLFRLNVVTLPSGSQIGMDGNTCFWVGAHYNITGAICATLFAIAVYMMATQKPLVKAAYAISAVIHLAVLLLSNSRTVYVSVVLLSATIGFFAAWERIAGKSIATRCAVSAAAALVCGAIIWLLRPLAFKLFESATHFSAYFEKGSEQAASAVRETTDLSGRTAVWQASIKVIFANVRNFLFGVTPAGVTDALIEYGGLKGRLAHAHNIILQMGAALGFPAMAAFLFFLVRIAIKSLKVLFAKGCQPFKGCYAVPLALLMLVTINMAEAYLYAYFSIMSSVFFLFCGWVNEMPSATKE